MRQISSKETPNATTFDVFGFRDGVIDAYQSFSRSFGRIKAADAKIFVDGEYNRNVYWPDPLIQLNPSYVHGESVEDLVSKGDLHRTCLDIFRLRKPDGTRGAPLQLWKHQEQAMALAARGKNYVVTTGTGSGKSLAFFIPIVDAILRAKEKGAKPSTKAIIVYPMNALANSQIEELDEFFGHYKEGTRPVTYALYTGQLRSDEERRKIAASRPDILLTNYMMLELLMTRQDELDRTVIGGAHGMQFLVLDELHTYRGRQGADVAMLVRRVREALSPDVQCIGTSATMVNEGDLGQRNRVVAEVASKIFGSTVEPDHIVNESLQRQTPREQCPENDELTTSVKAGVPRTATFKELREYPISSWIELNLGLSWEDERWVRAKPITLGAGARRLSAVTGLGHSRCLEYLRDYLLYSYDCRDSNGKPLFAFRLHQFISGPGFLYSTLEEEGIRSFDLGGQQFLPGSGMEKRLFRLYFCRNCGQEYYPVWHMHDTLGERLARRDINETKHQDDDVQYGFFWPDPQRRWDETLVNNYPEAWLETHNGALRIKPHYRKLIPVRLTVTPDGKVTKGEGLNGLFFSGAFRFCTSCEACFARGKDALKLVSLGGEGRSSATTVLTLSTLYYMLFGKAELDDKAKKLLGFSDNRQDASLQAGHFNDFLQILLLRSALLHAVRVANDGFLTDSSIAVEVFKALGFDTDDTRIRGEYLQEPEAKGIARKRAEEAMRNVLGYRLYLDLRRGWRINNPNLEQLGLLEIGYDGLDELCSDENVWEQKHPMIAQAKPEIRRRILTLLFDDMRRKLCLDSRYLEETNLEQWRNQSNSYLREPWGFTEEERTVYPSYMVKGYKPKNSGIDELLVPISLRSYFGQAIKLASTWGNDKPTVEKVTEDVFSHILDGLVDGAKEYGYLKRCEPAAGIEAYQLVSEGLQWKPGVTPVPKEKRDRYSLVNTYFEELYQGVADLLQGRQVELFSFEAREHTAQVDDVIRQEREDAFREGRLRALFCSPTMELGVNISTLNTVYLRNVPPTPANYAQRSGRAGRSGQPALVLTYCAALSPHDQYFFADPVRTVHGEVSPPAIDLANEELVESHLYATWLSETGKALPKTVNGMLDMSTPDTMPISIDFERELADTKARDRAHDRSVRMFDMLASDLGAARGVWLESAGSLRTAFEDWARHRLMSVFLTFDASLNRWRDLYRATKKQIDDAHKVMTNPAAPERDRKIAAHRHREAMVQHDLLLETRSFTNSDFSTYRYLASQGFLPGYNFPRLPLVAYIPARKGKIGRESYLSRPRFLAISEFGPQALIYHEGSQYRVRQVIVGPRAGSDVVDQSLPVQQASLCPECGYGHFGEQPPDERCRACNHRLKGGKSVYNLFRIEHVSTRRANRITCDEEERLRQGYEMLTTIQFAVRDGRLQRVVTDLSTEDGCFAQLQYGPATTVRRMNLGWRRRKEKSIYGFNIDVGTGMWCKDDQAPPDEDNIGEDGSVVQRISPYVEDRRNVLILKPAGHLELSVMATIQYALKRGIETEFQLETTELMTEPLPHSDSRNAILFYESAEGGAGVLTRLATDRDAITRIARTALQVCHFKRSNDVYRPNTLDDTDQKCEAACYRCILSYYNQPDHENINRHNEEALQFLCSLIDCRAEVSTVAVSRAEQRQELEQLSNSSLEKAWLEFMESKGYRLPDRAQVLIEQYSTRPDYVYSEHQALIYVDGPHHETDDHRRIDAELTAQLEEQGYLVVRFPKEQDRWPAIVEGYPDVFGRPNHE